MVNLTHEELKETKAGVLPPASLEALKLMRQEMCSTSTSYDFKLQPSQRFLRRILSPDSPTRNLLMVHGTGAGKTCTAIQIAEEYIIRPEFQDKRVFVLANPSIQQNFKDQIFDISRVKIDEDGLLLSKQCTGRRYLDIIQRAQNEPLRLSDKTTQARVMNIASKVINEFYEFQGYQEFANIIERQKLVSKNSNIDAWIHETFDNRLIIVDEAHNLRETSENESSKLVAIAIEQIIRTANNITLVLLTATPMYDTYDELLYYFNLFLWNDRKQDLKKGIKTSDIFTETGDFKEGKEAIFRGWCQEYVSYVKGENPFTFPFRLPPPDDVLAAPRTKDITGKEISSPRKYLKLTGAIMSRMQSEAVKNLTVKATMDPRLLCVYPKDGSFRETFQDYRGEGYVYRDSMPKFLAPSSIAEHSAKFSLITKIIEKSKGISFVYSNLVESGALLFAMCLEEHGYEPAIGNRMLVETSGEIVRGTKGKYVLFTSETSDADIKRAIVRLRSPANREGADIKVVIASPKVSEGVDFRFVRQVHVLDPWFNMSRIEQVIGRGMRTCSHAELPFEEQNTTVYLHVCRYAESDRETLDEYIYRVYVESKAERIAKVKRIVMESAMDCPLQSTINSLPKDWRKGLRIPQIRSQDGAKIELTLQEMSAPTFENEIDEFVCRVTESEQDPDHQRPLTSILDVKDEILDKLLKLFVKKSIWLKNDLYTHPMMKEYTSDVLTFTIQNAIKNGFQIKDKKGRIGFIEAKKNVFAFTSGPNQTMFERVIGEPVEKFIKLTTPVPVTSEEDTVIAEPVNIETKRDAYEFPEFIKTRFNDTIKSWFIVDNVLTPEEKIQHLLSVNWTDPPVYAKPLLITKDDGKKLFVLGSNKIYNEEKEIITPIGKDADAYRKWLNEHKTQFIEQKENIFASMKENTIIFNIDDKSADIKRAARSKNIGGRSCTNFKESVLNAFAQWLNGENFPEEVKTKKDRCLYLDLLLREAVLSNKPNLFWITPEEYSIFDENENRADLIKRLKD